MEGLGLDAFMVLLALFLVALNGLFVAAEFGFVKIRATQVDRLVQEGWRRSGPVRLWYPAPTWYPSRRACPWMSSFR